MANDTQNKPGNKAPAPKEQDKTPMKDATAKPTPEKSGAADKAPAPKAQDKPPAKDAAAKHTPEKPGVADKAPAPKAQDKPPAAKKIVPFDKNKAAQEEKKAAEKKAAAKEVAEKKAAAEKAAAEKAEAEKAAEKVRLEKELREKFNIPKSSKPVEPWIAPEEETVVRITHKELHSFKDHPFHVEKNTKFLALAASIRARGVTQPAIVRPREAGGFEIISGHRRDAGSIEAGVPYTPCIIRELNDDQAIQQMVEDNVNHRDMQYSQKEYLRELSQMQSQLTQAQNRIAELDTIIKRLYEDSITGVISTERFMKLSSSYEMEQLELSKLTEQLIAEISKEESKNLNVNKFVKIAKKYANLSELDVTSVREMIDKIIVHAPDRSTGKRTQQVDIHYNFVGIIGKLDIEKIREELKQDQVAPATENEKATSVAS